MTGYKRAYQSIARLLLSAMVASTLAVLPASSRDDIQRNGLVEAYSCDEAAAAIETIPALDGFGFGGSNKFITAYPFEESAGYAWSDIQKSTNREFVQLNLDFEGDAKAVQVSFCFRPKNGGKSLTVAVPLTTFLTNGSTSPNGITTGRLNRVQIKELKGVDLDQFELFRLVVKVQRTAVSKPQSVMFGDIQAVLGADTVEPVAVLTARVSGERGCKFQQPCR